jgi:hypothetical protein
LSRTDVKEGSSESENARLLEKPGVRKKNLRDERTQPGPDPISSGFSESEGGGSVIITVRDKRLAGRAWDSPNKIRKDSVKKIRSFGEKVRKDWITERKP